MKIDEARERILAIFSDTAAESLEMGELPDSFMVDFIERTISVCGPKYFKNSNDKEEVLHCLETLKQSIESYQKTAHNLSGITESELPEINTLLNEGSADKIQIASSKLKTIQKNLQEEIITAGNAIELFQEQIEFIRKISHFDAVTKLLNSYSFVNDMLPILKIGARRDLDMGLMMIEIANYEEILAEHGSTVFNKILIYVTRVLKNFIRTENKIYKYNLNTFLVLLNRSEEGDLERTEKRVVSQITKNLIEYNKKPVRFQVCSAKVTHRTADTIDSLIERLQANKECIRKD